MVGDLFANYAAKYVGIGRAAPLMNTNQLWGLAWGVLVFGEFAGQSGMAHAVTIGGSLIVIAGAVSISSAVAPEAEQASRRLATLRECERYGLDVERVEASMAGTDPLADEAPGQRWWDAVIVAAALGIFVFLATITERPPFAWDHGWAAGLFIAMLATLFGAGYLFWKQTRFS